MKNETKGEEKKKEPLKSFCVVNKDLLIKHIYRTPSLHNILIMVVRFRIFPRERRIEFNKLKHELALEGKRRIGSLTS